MAKNKRAPISLARVRRLMAKPGREGKTCVVVGTVTNDMRLYDVPKLKVRKNLF